MAKAYDKMSWWFIIQTLRAFGFSEMVIDMIWRVLSNYWYSIIINGQAHGYFKSSRGVKQGDTLSPTLFIIVVDVLIKGLIALNKSDVKKQFTTPLNCNTLARLSYVDDLLIFANSAPRHLREIKDLLHVYEVESGQTGNISKSFFIVDPNSPPIIICRFSSCTGYQKGGVPFNYLGWNGEAINNFAEALALLTGLQMCLHSGINHVAIEMDSLIIVNAVKGNAKWPWNCLQFLRQIAQLLQQLQYTISHVYREANSVADFLCNYDVISNSASFNVVNFLHQLLGIVRLDKMGFPYVRLC